MPSARKKQGNHETILKSILSGHSPEVRAWVEELRKLIQKTIPEAEERAYPGWRALGYRHTDVGYFCGLYPQPDRVDVAFEFGVLLPDPDAILDGNGKQVRYVHIRSEQDIHTEALKALLTAAIALPPDRGTRLALIGASARPV